MLDKKIKAKPLQARIPSRLVPSVLILFDSDQGAGLITSLLAVLLDNIVRYDPPVEDTDSRRPSVTREHHFLSNIARYSPNSVSQYNPLLGISTQKYNLVPKILLSNNGYYHLEFRSMGRNSKCQISEDLVPTL